MIDWRSVGQTSPLPVQTGPDSGRSVACLAMDPTRYRHQRRAMRMKRKMKRRHTRRRLLFHWPEPLAKACCPLPDPLGHACSVTARRLWLVLNLAAAIRPCLRVCVLGSDAGHQLQASTNPRHYSLVPCAMAQTRPLHSESSWKNEIEKTSHRCRRPRPRESRPTRVHAVRYDHTTEGNEDIHV